MNYFHQSKKKKTACRISDLTNLVIFVRDKSQKVCNILFFQLLAFYFLLLCVMSISFTLRCLCSILKYSYYEEKATLNKTYKASVCLSGKITEMTVVGMQ